MKKLKKIVCIMSILAAVCLCYSIPCYAGVKRSPAISSITLNTKSVKMTDGNSYTLKAKIYPSNVKDKRIIWTSSNSKVASVNSKGKVTAHYPGTTVITAKTSNKKTARCTIQVRPKDTYITKLQSTKKGYLNIQYKPSTKVHGYQIQYSPYANMKSAKYISINNRKIYNYTTKGLVSGSTYYVRVRTFNIINKKRIYSNWSKAKSQKIYSGSASDANPSQSVVSVKLDSNSKTMSVGNKLTLKATALPTNAKDKRIIWTSSNSKVASVDSRGNVTAHYPGTAVITAQSVNKKTAKCTIQVKAASTSITKLQSPKNGWLNIQYKANSKVNGYQIQYSNYANMKYGLSYITINNKQTYSYTIKGLTKGVTYHVRVRTFNIVNGKRIYSDWSPKKSMRIKGRIPPSKPDFSHGYERYWLVDNNGNKIEGTETIKDSSGNIWSEFGDYLGHLSDELDVVSDYNDSSGKDYVTK